MVLKGKKNPHFNAKFHMTDLDSAPDTRGNRDNLGITRNMITNRAPPL